MDMNFFPIITLGFLLGVRHATDADHVVAVTTIVSRQKKVKAASVIGAVWGIGHTLTVFLVGIIHGLAGSAAIAILILTTIKNPREAVLYLLVFGVGTVAGMMTITTAIGFPLIASSKKLASFDRIATIVSGFLSLSFGLWLAYQIGVVEGLLGF